MKYFQDEVSGVHALSDFDIANGGLELLPVGSVEITEEEAQSLQAPSIADLWAAYQATAQAALDKSDVTMLRCAENSVTVPPAWATYRKALRTIIGATSGDPTAPLPTRPSYPAGT